MERKTIDQIMHNAQLKKYPDGSAVLLISDRAIFREPGWESARESSKKIAAAAVEVEPDPERGNAQHDEGESGELCTVPHAQRAAESLERSRRRARSKVSDYAKANQFDYFITLTLDAAVIDRYSVDTAVKRLRPFLDNAVRRHGLKYILIPELHQDGAVHFHGLINEAFQMVDSGTIKLTGEGAPKKPKRPRSRKQRQEWLEGGGQVVYNIADYKLGFSTAIGLYGDYNKAVAYVCKYIGKGTGKIGGRWYYSGGDLKSPSKEYFDVDYAELRQGEHSFTIPRLGAEVVKLEVSKNG